MVLFASEGIASPQLLGWWKFDETAGVTAFDSTPFGNDGTVVNATWSADGRHDGSLLFDGTQDFVSIPATAVASLDRELTVAFWQEGSPGIHDAGGYAVQAKTMGGGIAFQVALTWYGDIYWDTVQDRTYYWAPSHETEGGWRHWAFTKNATTGQLKIYVDGVLVRTDFGSTLSFASIDRLVIGAQTQGSYGYLGKLDDFRIYGNELTADEIAQLYTDGGLKASHPGPADGATGFDRNSDLRWASGADGVMHDVYFGQTSPGLFMGTQAATTFDLPTLEPNTTYFWRIDEVDGLGNTTVGDVWSFGTYGGSWPAGKYRNWGEQTIALLEADFNNPDSVYYFEDETRIADSFTWGLSTYLRSLATAYELTCYGVVLNLMEGVAIDALDGYYDPVSNGIGGYWLQPISSGPTGARLTDENTLLAIALLRAYQVTGDRAYFDRAENAFKFVMAHADMALGGGIWWSEDRALKPTATAAPTVLAALMFYEATGRSIYLTIADRLLSWMDATLLDSRDGLYFDHLRADGFLVDMKWLYNQTTAMLAYLRFHAVAGNSAHLGRALELAEAIEARWLDPVTGRVNAIAEFSYDIVEAYGALYQQTGEERWLALLQRILAFTYDQCRDANGRYPDSLNEVGTSPYTEWQLHKLASVLHMYWHAAQISAPGVVVAQSGPSTAVAEQDLAPDSYTVSLNTRPSAPVSVTIHPDADPDAQVEVNGAGVGTAVTLVFSPSDWEVKQTVVVRAGEDALDEGLHTSSIAHSVSSSDPSYHAGGVESVTVRITDNDDARLKGWWAFEDGPGQTAADSSSSDDDGRLFGPTWSFGQDGWCLDFDGVNDYVSIQDSDVSSSPLTVSAWIRAEQWPWSVALGVIVDRMDWSLLPRGFSLRAGQGGKLSFVVGDGLRWGEVVSPTTMSAREWHHVAATYDESHLRVYIDGIEQGSTPWSAPILPSPFPLHIGRSAFDANRRFEGRIDDVRIYDAALSAVEIKEIYEGS